MCPWLFHEDLRVLRALGLRPGPHMRPPEFRSSFLDIALLFQVLRAVGRRKPVQRKMRIDKAPESESDRDARLVGQKSLCGKAQRGFAAKRVAVKPTAAFIVEFRAIRAPKRTFQKRSALRLICRSLRRIDRYV